MNFKIRILLAALFAVSFAYNQDRNLDKLEMLYDQGHYKMVLKKANKLLDNPDYDYSEVPGFYKSMALFQMNQNLRFRKHNKNSLNEAIALWEKFLKNDVNRHVFDAHIHEIIELKQDLILWNADLKNLADNDTYDQLTQFLATNFDYVEDIQSGGSDVVVAPPVDNAGDSSGKKQRNQLIKFSKTLLGIKYRYGGIDKKGFDCSGFTSYVFKRFDISLPRRAADQHLKSNKKKIKDAKPGDLVFFSNGGGVNHVGIIVSNEGDKPIMIHASTSQGIVETDILANSYWKPRLKFCGTYLD